MQIIDGDICTVEGVKAAGACQVRRGSDIFSREYSCYLCSYSTNQVIVI